MIRLSAPAAMVAFAAAAILGVLARPLLPIDETRYLAVAWEMRVTGDWLVPHINGALYTHKPPLLFWLINLVWSVFGVSDFGARLVGPAFGTAAIGATALLARRLWPDRPGVGDRAALILAGFGVYVLYAGLTMFDAMLTLAVVLGVAALAAVGRSRWAWPAFGAALAFGAFAKGPVVLIHLLPVAILAPVWAGIGVRAMLRGLAIGLATGVAIVALWLVPAILSGGPDYRDAVLWSQHAGRISNSFAHLRPWWYFLAMLPVLLWPWAWSRDVWRSVVRLNLRDPGLRLCAIWGASALILFSAISGKQTHYLLPAMPAVALALARATATEPVRAPLAGLLPAVLGLGLIAVAFGLSPNADLDTLAQPAWALALVGLLLIGLGASALRLRGGGVAALGLATPPILALVFAFGAPGPIYDARPIGAILKAHEPQGVAILREEYQGEFTFAGRLTEPVTELRRLPEALAWLDGTPGGVLLARLEKDHPEAPPLATILYRNRPYGLWVGPEPTPSSAEPRS